MNGEYCDAGDGAAEPELIPEGPLQEHSDEDTEVHMSAVCPLNDELLPIAADGLRLKQVSLRHKLQSAKYMAICPSHGLSLTFCGTCVMMRCGVKLLIQPASAG